ncbi:MAG TPA: hypothetical protein VFT74_05605 [Isosphaeraceae bacterium]|nr:hypothetical protein [Isosphaeraceae bacterium]
MLENTLTEAPLPEDSWDEIELIPEGWSPSPDVHNHDGGPLFEDRVFFAPPPPEIGEVVTASSTLPVGKKPMSTVNRFLLAGFAGSLVAVGLNLAGLETALQVLAGLVVLPVVFWFTRFKHTLRYVGKNGVAILTAKSRPDRIDRTEVFLFSKASELRTGQTRQYVNGVYSGTSYAFTWTDPAGKKAFKLSGTYRGEKNPPKPKDPFHFAESAEMAWSFHLLDQAEQELKQNGSIRFRLSGKDWVSVGPGFLEFARKGVEERWEREEIGGISIGDGVFKVKRTDAQEGWFSSKGVIQFTYASMSNAKLFLIALSRILGYTFN